MLLTGRTLPRRPPKVVKISSNYKTEVSATKFLAKHPVIKAGGHSHFFSVLSCEPTESLCLGRLGTGPPLLLHVHLSFLGPTCLSPI